MPQTPLATLVTTLPAAAYGRYSSTPKSKILSTALLDTGTHSSLVPVIGGM